MDPQKIHDLAAAYAQARLARKQNDADKCPSTDELYNFVYDYQFALKHILEQLKSCPKV